VGGRRTRSKQRRHAVCSLRSRKYMADNPYPVSDLSSSGATSS
jgi:hypothetical protein